MITTLKEIEDWIIYNGGICPTHDNHFGTDINAVPELNLCMQQRPEEISRLIKFFLDKKIQGESLKYYAEIGACSGGTTFAINKFLEFNELLIIDDGGAEASDFYVDQRGDQLRGQNLKFIPRIEIIGSSAEQRVIDMVLHISTKQKYDILFIDGDHSYQGIRLDTINYLSIVRQGGYVIFHDTAEHIPGIQQWLSELPTVFPNLVMVQKIATPSKYTNAFPNGIGITVYQKI